MIHQRLNTAEPSVPSNVHLDEDALGAFVEGRLEEAESSPAISHLIACASCRRTTAQLIRLDTQFDEEYAPLPDEHSDRGRSFLERLAAGLIPSFEEDAVFAYQETAELGQDTSESKRAEEDEETDR